MIKIGDIFESKPRDKYEKTYYVEVINIFTASNQDKLYKLDEKLSSPGAWSNVPPGLCWKSLLTLAELEYYYTKTEDPFIKILPKPKSKKDKPLDMTKLKKDNDMIIPFTNKPKC